MTALDAAPGVTRMLAASLRPSALAQGDVISLALGEPDFPTPEPILLAADEAARAGHTHYVDFSGDPELREAIAVRLTPRSVAPVTPANVLVTHGATGGLAAVLLGTVGPGDVVVLPEPTYSLYGDLVRFAGGTVRHVPLTADHHLDLDALAAALPGARLVVFCNPGNPTGAVFRRDELQRLAELLSGSRTLVVADEAYDALVYDGGSFASALEIEGFADRLVYVQTFSKTYAMTGWRVGFVVAPTAVLGAAAAVHRTFNGSVNAVAQRAALAALRHGPQLVAPMVEEYARRKDLMVRLLADVPGLDAPAPQGAFYVFARHPGPLSSAALTAHLLEQGVAVRAGTEYGPSGEGHLRLSFAAGPDELREGIRRLARGLELATR